MILLAMIISLSVCIPVSLWAWKKHYKLYDDVWDMPQHQRENKIIELKSLHQSIGWMLSYSWIALIIICVLLYEWLFK